MCGAPRLNLTQSYWQTTYRNMFTILHHIQMHLGRALRSKWNGAWQMKAILAVNMRDPGCGILGTVFYCHSLSQSLLGWPSFIVEALPTSSLLFFFFPPWRKHVALVSVFFNLGVSTYSWFPHFSPGPQLASADTSVGMIALCVLQTVSYVLFKTATLKIRAQIIDLNKIWNSFRAFNERNVN